MSGSALRILAPITKVDEEKRLVYGYAAVEELDKSGEIFDYESSVPHFKTWSESIAKATDGKSVGNVRAMHGKVSAGILRSIDFDPVRKGIPVEAYINDDAEWKKVVSGNYSAFSIGGSYVRKWADGDHTRYEARPSEISLVDNPAIPSATFQMVKADGSTVDVPITGRSVKQVWACGALGHEHAAKAEALACDEPEVEKRDFSTKQRKTAASSGAAMKDGSYPIENVSDLKNAIQAFGRAKNPAAAKRHIKARAAALGATAELPDAWKADDGADLRKGLYDVGDLAACLMTLNRIRLTAEAEAQYEGDGSSMPDALAAEVEHIGELLVQMVEEETGELTAGIDATEPDTNSAPDLTNLPGLTTQYGTWARADVEKLLARLPKANRDRGIELLKRAESALETMGENAQEDDMDVKDLEKLFAGQTEALGKSLDAKIDAAVKPIVERLEKAEKESAELKSTLEKIPAPAKTVLHAVEKTADTGTTREDDLEKDAPLGPHATAQDQERHRLMKAAMRRPFLVPAGLAR